MFHFALLVLVVQTAFSTTVQPENELHPSSVGLAEENVEEKVRIDLYYECLCPYSVRFYIDQFVPTVTKLHKYLDVHTYPHGNAKTCYKNTNITIQCQHGPEECYGNMLHACTIDALKTVTEYVVFNGCLMEMRSNDTAADQCGEQLHVDVGPVKRCAKSDIGFQMHRIYGEESHKAGFQHVPHVVINYNEIDTDHSHFMHDVCHAFKNPPTECKSQ